MKPTHLHDIGLNTRSYNLLVNLCAKLQIDRTVEAICDVEDLWLELAKMRNFGPVTTKDIERAFRGLGIEIFDNRFKKEKRIDAYAEPPIIMDQLYKMLKTLQEGQNEINMKLQKLISKDVVCITVGTRANNVKKLLNSAANDVKEAINEIT